MIWHLSYHRVITIVECNTRKYDEYIAGIVYKCEVLINNTGGNEKVMFPSYRVLKICEEAWEKGLLALNR